MWQISCVVITAISIYIHLVAGLAVWMNNMDFNIIGDIVFFFLIFPAFILYVIAQVVTLVLAFTSLRELPHGAFDTVHWTTFIPHV